VFGPTGDADATAGSITPDSVLVELLSAFSCAICCNSALRPT